MEQHDTSTEFDGRERTNGATRTRYDWSSTNPSTAVVETVAAATGRDPMTLEPLYERVDPDALDALVNPNGSNLDSRDVTVSFSFAGHSVTVHRDGQVDVRADE